MTMNGLFLDNISKSFKGKAVLKNISFSMHGTEIVALLGESGSGKSTLLRIISGFETPDQGEVRFNDNVLVNDHQFVKPEHRDIGMIFQDYALFPHLTVEQNIRYGSKMKASVEIADAIIDLFGLSDQLKKKPSTLSGGQQQRVAIARALVAKPRVLLLDEPFSNLDQSLRRTIRTEIKRINREFGLPMVMVSHDPEDALELADRIAVLKEGEMVQLDTPQNLYWNPRDKQVGSLFGYISNWIDGSLLRPEQIEICGTNATDSIVGSVLNVVFHSSGRFLIHFDNPEFGNVFAFHHEPLAIGRVTNIRKRS
jgi:iron(III) transport system ATP-binding protein